MRTHRIQIQKFIALFFLSCALSGAAHAQMVPPGELEGIPNYSYAVFVGTGYYRLDDRRLFVLRMPFSWRLREPDVETRGLGVKLLLPVAMGITNFEKIEDVPELNIDDLATVSFVPGVQLEYPATADWAIKPFLQAGAGWDANSSGTTFVWGGGLRTSYQPRIGETSPWTIGGEYLLAGNNPDTDDPNTRFSRLGGGLEYRHAMGWTFFNRRTFLHTHLVGYYYLNDVDFLPPRETIQLDHSIEIGLSLGIDPPLEYLGISLDQFGLGYKIGDDLRAITLIGSFPF